LPRLFLEQYLQKEYDFALMAEVMRLLEDAVNKLAEGRIYAHYNAALAAPTGDTVAYQVGDKVWNLTTTELGGAGSMYLLLGWVCVAAGTPGTWREMRVLTGN
jgi:uncharacterized membrane protein